MSSSNHFPGASKMIPTPDDYAIDPAADLAIQQAAAPRGAWKAEYDEAGDYPDDEGWWIREGEGIDEHAAAWVPTYAPRQEEKAKAIANAGTHAPAWLRRLIAAEEAILEWAEAVGVPVPHDAEAERRIEERESRLLILAARIREGRP